MKCTLKYFVLHVRSLQLIHKLENNLLRLSQQIVLKVVSLSKRLTRMLSIVSGYLGMDRSKWTFIFSVVDRYILVLADFADSIEFCVCVFVYFICILEFFRLRKEKVLLHLAYIKRHYSLTGQSLKSQLGRVFFASSINNDKNNSDSTKNKAHHDRFRCISN